MYWEKFAYLQTMRNAQKVNYEPGNKWIKIVDNTKLGSLLELRPYGHRIFFVHRKGYSPEILIGGFYQKNEAITQNEAIERAKKRIDDDSQERIII